VFNSTRGGDYRDLYVMNSLGYDVSRLTSGEVDSLAGPWSPDGSLIAFQTNREATGRSTAWQPIDQSW
jgi:Tol biopolymer transport system component